MTRLPNLERSLQQAAERQDLPALAQSTRGGWWSRRGSRTLLVALAALTTSGAAVAAGTGLLGAGAPVPKGPDAAVVRPLDPTERLRLAKVRAADPEDGPAWGIATYRANSKAPVVCTVVGRVQNGRLGVVGRDGVFGDDGRFHELLPQAGQGMTCGGTARNGDNVSFSSRPPVPASGYSGALATPIGGCRERVNLDGPTVSAQTRRKLKDVPKCAASSLRKVTAGFAGRKAAQATLTTRRRTLKLRLRPQDNGAFIFVTSASEAAGAVLRIRHQDGTICRPDRLLLGPGPSTPARRGSTTEAQQTCFASVLGR